MLFAHDALRAASRAACTAGSNMPINTAMIAITTSNSTSVKPVRTCFFASICIRLISNLLKSFAWRSCGRRKWFLFRGPVAYRLPDAKPSETATRLLLCVEKPGRPHFLSLCTLIPSSRFSTSTLGDDERRVLFSKIFGEFFVSAEDRPNGFLTKRQHLINGNGVFTESLSLFFVFLFPCFRHAPIRTTMMKSDSEIDSRYKGRPKAAAVKRPRLRTWMTFGSLALALLAVFAGEKIVRFKRNVAELRALGAEVNVKTSPFFAGSEIMGWYSLWFRDTRVEIDFSGRSVEENVLDRLGAFDHVSALNLDNLPVTDAGWKRLAAHADLKSLSLENVRITDAGLREISGLLRLRTLNLARTAIGDEGISHLRDLLDLRDLNLADTHVGEAGLQTVARFEQLACLRLDKTRITDAGMERIRGLTKLREVHLSGVRLGDEGMKCFRNIPDIGFLDLASTRITDAGLKNLSDSKNLSQLVLSDTAVSDAGLAHLSRLCNLTIVDLHGTRIKGPGLQCLVQSRYLRSLNLLPAPSPMTD